MPDDLLGGLQQLVLLAVFRLGDQAWGARIQDELERRGGRSVAISTVYVTLGRLERRGLVRSWLGPPTPVRGGRAKRQYALTPSGARALQDSRAALARMWAGLRMARG